MVLNDKPMTWINPVTFETLAFVCKRKPINVAEWDIMITWCDQHVGSPGTDYTYDGGDYMQLPCWWFFRELDHMVAFQLAWS
jgi:hypothetical protein